MDAVDASAESSGTQRLPSTTPIDERWDRSRCLILRKAEHNAVRDFRWTQTDPITFAQVPASSRSYARKPLTRRSDPELASTRAGQVGQVDRPEQVNISSEDRLAQNLKQIEAENSELKKVLLAFQTRHTEKDVEQQKRQITLDGREQSIAQRERAQKEHREHLRVEWSNLDDAKKQAHAEAELKAKGAYEKRNTDLGEKFAEVEAEEERLKNRWIELKAEEASINLKVADAISTAERDVRVERRDLLCAASSKEREAQAHRDEAKQLLKDANQEKEDAITDRGRLATDYQGEWDDALKRFTKFLDDNNEALKYEQAQAIRNFIEKLENAEYRESFERSDYDEYRDVWDALMTSTAYFRKGLDVFSAQLRDAASAWNSVGNFEEFHPSFASKYPNLRAQIQQYTRTSKEKAAVAHMNAEQWDRTFAEDIRPKLVDQAHFSRMLTRTTRFDKPPSSNAIAEVLGQVLGVQIMEDVRKALAARKKELKHQVNEISDEVDVAKLSGEMAQVDEQQTLLKAFERFVSTLTKYQSSKQLRAGSSREKEIWDTTNAIDKRIGEASKQWRGFQQDHPRRVIGSELDDETQNKDRRTVGQTLRASRAQLDQLRETVQEASLLEQQLGEGGERVLRIDAKLDKEINSMYKLMRKHLERLIGDTAMTPPWSTFAFGAVSSRARGAAELRRRSIGATRAPTVPPAISNLMPTPSVRSKMKSERGPACEEISRLTRELRGGTTYNSNEARQQAEEKLQSLKQEDMRLDLERLQGRRADLLDNPGSEPGKLTMIEQNIKGIEKSLAATCLNLGAQQEPSGVGLGLNYHGRRAEKGMQRRRRGRAFTRTATTLTPSKTGPSTEPENAVPSVLGLKSTASQQTWHPLWTSQADLHGHGLEKKTAARISKREAIPRIPAPFSDAMFVPRALRVYSLHSLHTSAPGEQTSSDTQDSAPNSAFPTMQSLDESIVPSQSSIETVSDPESDGSYEPSDSEGSIAGSEPVESSQDTTNVDAASSMISTQEFADALEAQLPAETAVPLEQNVSDLTYQISAEDYRRAAMASKSTNAAFWTYKLYKNAEGKTPTVHYCTTFETAETQAKQFLNEPTLGFDLEWEVGAFPGKSSIKNCVSLVQIASETKIGLFQLAMFKGDTAEQLMPPSLRKILESREVTKTGVNISGDANRIEKCFGFNVQGIFELSHLYNVVTWSEKSPERVNKRLLNLAEQVQNVLLLPLKKDAVRVSKWSQRLRPEQTEYAASDAYAGFRIYHTLEAKRKMMKPTPPRPAFWEDKKPLVLGDGTVMVPRKVIKRKADTDGKVVEYEDDEGEEYFDAVETLDPCELDTLVTGGVPLEGLSISYPTLPTLAETLAESQSTKETQESETNPNNQSMPTTTSPSVATQSDPKPKPTALSSPAVTAADTWAQTFRNSLPATHDLKTKQAHLRAYHLWHHQRHECNDVASMLRDPPLSATTIASYVLQTVAEGKERVEYDKARIEVVLGLLPSSVRGKYWWVVERVERIEVEKGVVKGYMHSDA